ncbi:hypothetical protein ILYODFUR_020452 [Ilyodon furcidens]|uniref:TNFR-Cys domain-containing protein n=1 Tax=Ilyodon furcidens TaxID=33524 RepID=A0ABV0TM51_9TELE
MGKLQASIACALLMVLDPDFALTASTSGSCPMCTTGYYLTQNCSRTDERSSGIKCAQCTNCLEKLLETLVPCSAYTDSVCGSNSTLMSTTAETKPTGVPPSVWIFTGVFASMLLVVALALFFKRMISTAKLQHAETGCSEMEPCHQEAELQACPA